MTTANLKTFAKAPDSAKGSATVTLPSCPSEPDKGGAANPYMAIRLDARKQRFCHLDALRAHLDSFWNLATRVRPHVFCGPTQGREARGSFRRVRDLVVAPVQGLEIVHLSIEDQRLAATCMYAAFS